MTLSLLQPEMRSFPLTTADTDYIWSRRCNWHITQSSDTNPGGGFVFIASYFGSVFVTVVTLHCLPGDLPIV